MATKLASPLKKEQAIPCSFSLFFQYTPDQSLEYAKFTMDEAGSLIFSHDLPQNQEIIAWIEDFFRGGSPPFPLKLMLDHLTPFTQEVLKALMEVPYGETISYGGLAKKAGHEKAARAVGKVCNINPYPLIIPCHRVIASDGTLGGFAYGDKSKWELLEWEAGGKTSWGL